MKNSSLRIFTSILSVLTCFACLPQMKAAPEVAPPPDGCYPGFTTAEGCLALQNLTTGSGNTGVGWRSLFSVADGGFNTGVGAGALLSNNGDNNTAVGAAALLLNATGDSNTAVGSAALEMDTGGPFNTPAVADREPRSTISATAMKPPRGKGGGLCFIRICSRCKTRTFVFLAGFVSSLSPTSACSPRKISRLQRLICHRFQEKPNYCRYEKILGSFCNHLFRDVLLPKTRFSR